MKIKNIIIRFLLKKIKRTAFLYFTFFIVSCNPSMNKISKINDFNTCIETILNSINRCQNKDDQKAEFDFTSKTLKLYIGKSIDDYENEWEIPFKELDENNTTVDVTSEYYSFQIYTVNGGEKIKYSEPGRKSSLTDQHNFYLPDYCFKKRERIKFIESFKRAIILSKS